MKQILLPVHQFAWKKEEEKMVDYIKLFKNKKRVRLRSTLKALSQLETNSNLESSEILPQVKIWEPMKDRTKVCNHYL